MKLNLCCSDQFLEGFIGVDLWTPPWATDENFIKADLRHSWPFADGSIEHVRAHDAIEHMPDKIHTMNELHRVLKPGGTVEIVVPTTDGPGAWQDPTHCSYWNRNSFLYHTAGDPHHTRFHEAYGIKGAFNVKVSQGTKDSDGVTKLQIVLEAVKELVADNDAENLTPVEILNTRVKTLRPMSGGFAFSILHTSARPEKWREIYDAWIGAAVNKNAIEYILCVDERWGFNPSEWPWNTKVPLRPQDKVIWNTGRKCYVDGVNLAAEASSGDVLIVNADDQYPCERWDEQLLVAPFCPEGRSNEYVIEVTTNTPTEHERGILVMPILSRERYERFGWVFYPEYSGMFADNDFCAMARRDGVVIDARHLVFPHKHWINQQRNRDVVDDAQSSHDAYSEGYRIYTERAAVLFAGVPPQQPQTPNMPVITTTGTGKRRTVCLVTPGDTFSGLWLTGFTWIFAHLMSKYDVVPRQGFTSDVGMTRALFTEAVLESEQPVIEYVLWIDDDNTVTPEQFEMLMADLDAHPELDAVVGWCWILRHDLPMTEAKVSVSCGHLSEIELTVDGKDVSFCKARSLDYAELMAGPDDVTPIGYSGFPVVLMRASLLRNAGDNPFLPIIDSRFKFGKSGEDLAFCARAAVRCGATFGVDRRVQVPHLKLMPAAPPQQVLDKHLKEAVTVK